MLSVSQVVTFASALALGCAHVALATPTGAFHPIETRDVSAVTDAEILALVPDLPSFQEDLDNLSESDIAELRGMSMYAADGLNFPHLDISEFEASIRGSNRTATVIEWMKDQLQNKKPCPKQGDACGPVCLPRYDKACHCCAPESKETGHRRPFGCLKIKCCPCMDKQTLDALNDKQRKNDCIVADKDRAMHCEKE